MMIGLSLVVFAVAQALAPPVLITSTGTEAAQARRVRLVDVDVSAGREVLWRGTLRVARSASASFSMNQNEAVAEECQPVASDSSSTVRRSLSVNLSSYRTEQTNVQVEWTRPSDTCSAADDDDGDGVGTRTVQLSQRVGLVPGKPVLVRGDAGLVVRLILR